MKHGIWILVILLMAVVSIQLDRYKKIKQELSEISWDKKVLQDAWYAYHDIDIQLQALLTGCPDSAMIYHTAVSESGNFHSNQFQRNRNLFGFHNGQDYLKFNHWKESFDYFMNKFYCDIRHGESYCAFLRRKKFGTGGFVNYCTQK